MKNIITLIVYFSFVNLFAQDTVLDSKFVSDWGKKYNKNFECGNEQNSRYFAVDENNCNQCCKNLADISDENINVSFKKYDINTKICVCNVDNSKNQVNIPDEQFKKDVNQILTTNKYQINKRDCEIELKNRSMKTFQAGNIPFFNEENVKKDLRLFNIVLQMSKKLDPTTSCIHIYNKNESPNNETTSFDMNIVYKGLSTGKLMQDGFLPLGQIVKKINQYDNKIKTYFDPKDINGFADQNNVTPNLVRDEISGFSSYKQSEDLNNILEFLKDKNQTSLTDSQYMSDTHVNAYLALSRSATLKQVLINNGADEAKNISLSKYKNSFSSCRNLMPTFTEYADDKNKIKINNQELIELKNKYLCANRRKVILTASAQTFGVNVLPTATQASNLPGEVFIDTRPTTELTYFGCYKINTESADKVFNKTKSSLKNAGLDSTNTFPSIIYKDKYKNLAAEKFYAQTKLFGTTANEIPEFLSFILPETDNRFKASKNMIASYSPANNGTKTLASLLNKTPASFNELNKIFNAFPYHNIPSVTGYSIGSPNYWLALASTDLKSTGAKQFTYSAQEALDIIQFAKNDTILYGAPEWNLNKPLNNWKIKLPSTNSPAANQIPTGNWTLNDLFKSYLLLDKGCTLYKSARKDQYGPKRMLKLSTTQFQDLIKQTEKITTEMNKNNCIVQTRALEFKEIQSLKCEATIGKPDVKTGENSPPTNTPPKKGIPNYHFASDSKGDIIEVNPNIIKTLETLFPKNKNISNIYDQANSILCLENSALGFLPTDNEQMDCGKSQP